MSTQPPDPDANKLSSACLDLLLIELVPLAQRIVSDLHKKETALLRQQQSSLRSTAALSQSSSVVTGGNASLGGGSAGVGTEVGALAGAGQKVSLPDRTVGTAGTAGMGGARPGSGGSGTSSTGAEKGAAGSGPSNTNASTETTAGGIGALQDRSSITTVGTGTAGGGGGGARGTLQTEDGDADGLDGDMPPQDDDEAREAVFFRLDALGYRVGQGLVERFSATLPRPTSSLDMIKFLCKDLWTLLFRKQIDNLKTNHRGTFVLTDARFPHLARMSVDRARGPRGLDEALAKAQPFLWFPCGVIRGVLSGFGLNVTVQAETTDLKSAVFQIRTVGSKP